MASFLHSSGDVHISIVIPAYNEESRLGATLDRICDFICCQQWAAEVIVVDGCSQDGTAGIVRRYSNQHSNVRLLQIPSNRGKGYCVREGVMNARGSFILFTDADLSAPIEESLLLLAALETGADIAIGSRWMLRELQSRRQPPLRQGLGRIFNLMLRLILGLDYKDTQCGFKAFRRHAAHTIFALQKIERWGFDPEILFLARQANLTVAEVPVRWAHDNRSRINPVADGLRMSLEILSVRYYSLTGRYGNSAHLASALTMTAGEQTTTATE